MNKLPLTPETAKIIEAVSQLECIKPFVLVGGTALTLQLNSRLSEDLDFMRWRKDKNDSLEVGWPKIQKELETIGNITDRDIAGFDQVTFGVNNVKISFYAAPRKKIPSMEVIPYLNNLRLANANSIGVMKMEAMLRRSKFRDYYDIYCILKNGADINDLVTQAVEHSNFQIKTKNLLAILTNGKFFAKDQTFAQLQPIYDVSPNDIEQYIKSLLTKNIFSKIENKNKEIENSPFNDVNDIISLIIQRTSDPRTKAFTPEQIQIINDFLNQASPDNRREQIENLWNLCAKEFEKLSIRDAWIDDTYQELRDLADGKIRSNSNARHL